MLRAFLLAFLCLVGPAVPGAAAQDAAPPAASIDDGTIRVGVLEDPPFAMTGEGGPMHGIAVDFFRLAAESLGTPYEFVPIAPGEGLRSLSEGAVRVLLPVNATPALEAEADLTHPVYTATLGIAAERDSRILNVLQGLASWQFLRTIFALSLLLLAVGAVVWALERRGNDEQFSSSPLRGLGDGFWWAGVTLTTIGYGDKAPATTAGRAVAMLWMLVGLAVSAALTATVVTLAGVESGDLRLSEAVKDRRVVAVEEGAALAFLQRAGADAALRSNAAEAVAAVEAGDFDAAIAAAPSLRWAMDRSGSGLRLSVTPSDPVLIAFALREGDPLREGLNRALLAAIGSEAGQAIARQHAPDAD